jgi:hypothetical protein
VTAQDEVLDSLEFGFAGMKVDFMRTSSTKFLLCLLGIIDEVDHVAMAIQQLAGFESNTLGHRHVTASRLVKPS